MDVETVAADTNKLHCAPLSTVAELNSALQRIVYDGDDDQATLPVRCSPACLPVCLYVCLQIVGEGEEEEEEEEKKCNVMISCVR